MFLLLRPKSESETIEHSTINTTLMFACLITKDNQKELKHRQRIVMDKELSCL